MSTESLERELADAKRRIAELTALNRVEIFRREYCLQPAAARLLVALYEAHGGYLPEMAMRRAIACDPARRAITRNTVSVQLYRVRHALEPGALEVKWGETAYRLTAVGLAEVADILGERLSEAA